MGSDPRDPSNRNFYEFDPGACGLWAHELIIRSSVSKDRYTKTEPTRFKTPNR